MDDGGEKGTQGRGQASEGRSKFRTPRPATVGRRLSAISVRPSAINRRPSALSHAGVHKHIPPPGGRNRGLAGGPMMVPGDDWGSNGEGPAGVTNVEGTLRDRQPSFR